MYAEELKHRKINDIVGIFLTLGIVAAVFFAVMFVNVLQLWLGVYWIQIILYAVCIWVVFLIFKRWIIEYIYLIEKDRITFGRRIGKREKELLFVPFRDVISFGPYAEMQDKIDDKKKKFKYTFKKKDDWTVINCTGCTIIVTVTQEYINALKKATGRKVEKESPEGQQSE
ncbi:hypothetical protein LJC56_12175 [Christensenellaceae bacterium OttesenSCG-928-K19]|nr:hypothetical protein [Christensenellaceae bacterium OttesenSCG-928-K19]